MVNVIKTKLYELIKELGYPVVDTAYSINDEINYPFIRLNLLNISRENYNNSYTYSYSFQIDIFTNYKGEKQTLEIEEAIFNKISSLYEIDNIAYIRQRSFKLFDDKSLSIIRKHGVIVYDITVAGLREEK